MLLRGWLFWNFWIVFGVCSGKVLPHRINDAELVCRRKLLPQYVDTNAMQRRQFLSIGIDGADGVFIPIFLSGWLILADALRSRKLLPEYLDADVMHKPELLPSRFNRADSLCSGKLLPQHLDANAVQCGKFLCSWRDDSNSMRVRQFLPCWIIVANRVRCRKLLPEYFDTNGLQYKILLPR